MKNVTLFFDIDGTLIATGGAGQEAMGDTVAGRDDSKWKDQVRFSGRTDRSLINQFFQIYNIAETEENFVAYRDEFLKALEAYLPERKGRVLPGVTTMLDHLSNQPNVRLGLLTGNLRKAARLKLDHYGLAGYFYAKRDAVGGFGDNQPDRDDVAREALAEASDVFGSVSLEDAWVIGDTPADVKCARAIGVKVAAVATGRYGFEELAETKPDVTLQDLQSADAWWQQLAESGVAVPT